VRLSRPIAPYPAEPASARREFSLVQRYFGAVVDPSIRERRRQRAAKRARKRLGVALVLMALFHLVAIPAVLLSFRHQPGAAPEVALVRIPAREWDAAMAAARPGADPAQRSSTDRQARAPASEAAPEPAKPKEPEKAPGQVVETAPGNDQRPDDASFAAESDNRVDRQTISRDRRPGAPVTTPRTSAPELSLSGGERSEEGDALTLGADGSEGEESGPAQKAGDKLEIPSIEARDELALKISPEGVGSVPNRKGSEALRGNSDRFRIQAGDGEGDADRPGGGGPAGGKALQLFPSASVVDRIVGAPAPDHVEGIEEGEGTFLNTREWRYASFMNRMKKGVSQRWDPNRVVRSRDPTGNIYLWKDRYTVLSVTLGSDGRLADIYVHTSSGVDFLDQEAIAAFERAQPFPHPPKGMMDEQGQIHFQFGFFLDTGKVGMRLFR